jgi:DNA polymerase I-like protein with 3'-5' exonuclease and polymerase domains
MGLLQDTKLADLYTHDLAGLNPLLNAMSQRGMPVDAGRREAVAQALQQERQDVLAQMQLLVPDEARRLKIYKRKANVVLPFVPSNDQMKRYCQFKGYKLPVRDGRETADEAALRRLALKHEADPLFPLILQYRGVDKLLGTYVGRPV